MRAKIAPEPLRTLGWSPLPERAGWLVSGSRAADRLGGKRCGRGRLPAGLVCSCQASEVARADAFVRRMIDNVEKREPGPDSYCSNSPLVAASHRTAAAFFLSAARTGWPFRGAFGPLSGPPPGSPLGKVDEASSRHDYLTGNDGEHRLRRLPSKRWCRTGHGWGRCGGAASREPRGCPASLLEGAHLSLPAERSCPSIVASATTSAAARPRARDAPSWRSAARRISRKMLRELLHAAPSAPSET